MTELRIQGLPKRRKYRRYPDHIGRTKDLANRDFTATMPNELWVTDIAEHTPPGKRNCTAVSRGMLSPAWLCAGLWTQDRIPCWSTALWIWIARSRSRQPGTILHADHGTQPTSWAFTQHADRYDFKISMGTIGDCYDNVMIEAFWG
jgi:putative transposase